MLNQNISELQKMISGQLYYPLDIELSKKRSIARHVIKKLAEIQYEDWDGKRQLYSRFFGGIGDHITIE